MIRYNSSYRPPDGYKFDNTGQVWTPTQYAQLTTYFGQGTCLQDICIAMQRPPGGILAKLAQLQLVTYDTMTNQYHVNERKKKPEPIQESEVPMNEKRIDWLTTQYVWVIQNDSQYHELLTKAVSDRDFPKFRRVCGSAISDIRSALCKEGEDDSFFETNRYFVVLTLWAGMGGEQLHTNANYSFYLTGLRKTGTDYPSGPKGSEPTTEIFNPTSTVTQEVNIMTNKLFESKQFVGGIETTQLSEAQLIAVIKNTEDEIAKLRQIKTVSKKIAANIEAMEADLASVVAVLDAR